MSMARLSGRVLDRPTEEREAEPAAAPAAAPVTPERIDAKAPGRQGVKTPERMDAKASTVRAELDSLLSRLVDEAPMPAPRRRPAEARPAAVDVPAPAAPARRIPWRAVAFGVASTAVVAALAFAPRLKGLIAAPATRPDGTAAPMTGVERWLAENNGGQGYLI